MQEKHTEPLTTTFATTRTLHSVSQMIHLSSPPPPPIRDAWLTVVNLLYTDIMGRTIQQCLSMPHPRSPTPATHPNHCVYMYTYIHVRSGLGGGAGSSSNQTDGTGMPSARALGDTVGHSGVWRGGAGGRAQDVDFQINTLVRVGLLERSSSESVRFVAKCMVTVIYDMILHSRREDMHKVRHATFV